MYYFLNKIIISIIPLLPESFVKIFANKLPTIKEIGVSNKKNNPIF